MATPLVLVVNDDRAHAHEVRKALEDEGYRVEVTRSTRAMAVAKRTQPSMILLDVALPGTTGKDACARLRANAATRAIPLVGVIARRPEEVSDIPVSDWLPQPYARGELYAKVARWTTVI